MIPHYPQVFQIVAPHEDTKAAVSIRFTILRGNGIVILLKLMMLGMLNGTRRGKQQTHWLDNIKSFGTLQLKLPGMLSL